MAACCDAVAASGRGGGSGSGRGRTQRGINSRQPATSGREGRGKKGKRREMPRRHCTAGGGPEGPCGGWGEPGWWWHAFTWVDGPMSCVRAVRRCGGVVVCGEAQSSVQCGRPVLGHDTTKQEAAASERLGLAPYRCWVERGGGSELFRFYCVLWMTQPAQKGVVFLAGPR